MILISKDLDAI